MAFVTEPDTEQISASEALQLEALGFWIEAYILAEGPKKGQRLLVAASKLMDMRDAKLDSVVEFLPPVEAAEKTRRLQALRAWFRKTLPAWLRRLEEAG
jgi:hypothetical protein